MYENRSNDKQTFKLSLLGVREISFRYRIPVRGSLKFLVGMHHLAQQTLTLHFLGFASYDRNYLWCDCLEVNIILNKILYTNKGTLVSSHAEFGESWLVEGSECTAVAVDTQP